MTKQRQTVNQYGQVAERLGRKTPEDPEPTLKYPYTNRSTSEFSGYGRKSAGMMGWASSSGHGGKEINGAHKQNSEGQGHTKDPEAEIFGVATHSEGMRQARHNKSGS